MELLSAINISLRAIGVEAISAPVTEDPTANLVIDTITRVRRQILETGFGFNRRQTPLQLDANNRVPVAPEYLDVELPRDLFPRTDEGGDGARYVWNFLEDDWHDEAIDQALIVHDIGEFNFIPEPFARWIAAEAALTFFSEHDSNKPIPGRLIEERNNARQKAENAQPGVTIDKGTTWATRLARRTK